LQTAAAVAPTAANFWWWVQAHAVRDAYGHICMLHQIHLDKRTGIRTIYHQVNLFRYSCRCIRQEPSIYSEYELSCVCVWASAWRPQNN
jgi:hypothetical protein